MIKELSKYAIPLLVKGLQYYAPQVGIPVEVIDFAMKSLKKTRKSKEKLRKRIVKIDAQIEDLERKLIVARMQRANLIEQWSVLDGMAEEIKKREERLNDI